MQWARLCIEGVKQILFYPISAFPARAFIANLRLASGAGAMECCIYRLLRRFWARRG